MSRIIIPDQFRPSRSNPLREFLESRDGNRFRTQVALTHAMTQAVAQVSRQRKMQAHEVLDALLTQLVSAVQAAAPPSEWAEAGAVLADVLQSRLTIKSENDR